MFINKLTSQVLNKDVDEKEKQFARVVTQLHEISEKYELSEQQKHQSLIQLEDTMKRLVHNGYFLIYKW